MPMRIPSTSAMIGITIRPVRPLSQSRRRSKRGLRENLGGFFALFVFPMAAGNGLDRSLILSRFCLSKHLHPNVFIAALVTQHTALRRVCGPQPGKEPLVDVDRAVVVAIHH